MKKNILYLIISAIIFVRTINAQDIFKESDNYYSTDLISISKTSDENNNIIITGATTLKGTISIVVSEGKNLSAKYYKKAKTSSKSKAIDYIDLITVNLSPVKNGYKLEMRAPNPPAWDEGETGIVELVLTLPRLCNIDIDAQYFDVEAEGPFKTFIVPSSFGRISVSNVTENLELATSNRRVSVSDLSGEIYLSTTNSSLIASDINSPNKKVVIRNEGGDIKIDNITGELNIRNQYGRIDIDEFKPSGLINKIKGDNGPIIISISELNSTQMLISNRYEDIEITVPQEISAELSLAVEEDGKISVSNLPFKPDLVQPNRLNLMVKDGDALISGSIRGKGNIYLRGRD